MFSCLFVANLVHVDVNATASYDRALPTVDTLSLNERFDSDVGKVTPYDTSEL
jgi:hypothetical protein